MEGTTSKTIICALVVIVLASRVTGEYDDRVSDMVEGPRVERMHPETSEVCAGSNCLAQNSNGPVSAMWFGPRLGRRRRSDAKFSGKKIESLSEILASPNWNLVTIPGGSSNGRTSASDVAVLENHRQGTYTPRLGRELEDAISVYDLARGLLSMIEERTDNARDEQQSPPPPMFPPRLGRNLVSPRLEHELRDLLRKLQVQ